MEMFGKTLCVTYDELVGSGIMSKSNYKKHVREKKFVLLQKGGNGRKVRIVYESMPETIRANYDAKYPDAKKQLKKQIVPMNERLKGDEKAANFFRTYTPKITIERQTEYMLNVKVLNAMVAKEMDLKGIHNQSGYQHKPLVRDTIIALCESLRERYGHTLPKSAARLIEKYNDYKKRSYVALINGNIGNQVARKVGPKEGRLLLRLKRSKFPVYTDMQIFERRHDDGADAAARHLPDDSGQQHAGHRRWHGVQHLLLQPRGTLQCDDCPDEGPAGRFAGNHSGP